MNKLKTNHKINDKDFLILILLTLLIANPFILYLLFQKIFLVFSIIIIVYILLFTLYSIVKKEWLKAYVVNLLVLVSIYLHFETIFRYGFSDYVIEDLYQIENGFNFNKPGIDKILEDKEFKITYKTNLQGFRIPASLNKNRIVNACDWLVVGDSYTQGAQVEFEELYSTKLTNFYPDKIIVNAGISGLGLPEELALIKSKMKDLNPSLVILQICAFNDFMNVEQNAVGFADYLMSCSDLARSILYEFKYKDPGELPLGRWTEPFYDNEKDNADFNIFFKKQSIRKKNDLKNFTKYLLEINQLCKQSNIELILFLIPTKEQIYFKYFDEVIRDFKIDINDLDMNAPNHYLQNICNENNIKLIDLKSQFEQAEGDVYFEYDEHLNVKGHSETAEAIRKYLDSINLKSNYTFLSENCTGDRYPTYFNDDKQLLFQSLRHNNFEIFKSDSLLKNQTRITFNDIDDSHPDIDIKNWMIVYTEGKQEEMRTKVVLLNLISGVKYYLSAKGDEYSAIPKFYSNGKSVVLVRWMEGKATDNYRGTEIVSYDLETHEEKIIINNGFENWRPVISDGIQKLAYISRRNGNYDLFLFDLNENSEVQLTNTEYDEWDPNFNSTGSKIVYAAKKNGNWDLFEINIEKKGCTQLTYTEGNEWDPSYSLKDEIVFAGEFGLVDGIYKLKK